MAPAWAPKCATSENAPCRDQTSPANGSSLILAINQIALAEGLALGKALNIDPLLLNGIVNTSSGQPCVTAPDQADSPYRSVMVVSCQLSLARGGEQPWIAWL